MKVQCANCETMLNLPDDRLAPGSAFSFNCPKCQHKNTIQVPSETAPAPAPTSNGDDTPGVLGEFFEEGAKLALICVNGGPVLTQLKTAMKNLGYVPVVPASTRDALQRIRLTQFNVVLLDEDYEGQTREHNAVLRLIQPMEMTTRRRVFVALFGNDLKTMDHMTAYSLSVNAVVNWNDAANFEKILHKGLVEYERFYKVFFDVLREMGKA